MIYKKKSLNRLLSNIYPDFSSGLESGFYGNINDEGSIMYIKKKLFL